MTLVFVFTVTSWTVIGETNKLSKKRLDKKLLWIVRFDPHRRTPCPWWHSITNSSFDDLNFLERVKEQILYKGKGSKRRNRKNTKKIVLSGGLSVNPTQTRKCLFFLVVYTLQEGGWMIISRTFSVCNVSWYFEREKRHHLYFASNVQVYNSIMRWGEVRDCVLQNNCDWKTSFTLAFDIRDKTNVKDGFQSSVFQSWGTQFLAMNFESCFLPSFVDLFVRHLLSLSRRNYSHNDIETVLFLRLPVKTWFSMGKARYEEVSDWGPVWVQRRLKIKSCI